MQVSNSRIDVVIPFYKEFDSLEVLLRSIDDQDYKNISITVSIDKLNKRKKEFVSKLSENLDMDICITGTVERMGASFVRNLGARMGTGEILFFIDSDCRIYPGIFREIITQFELNPNIGFIYSSYKFEDGKYPDCHSCEFDPYLLETMNYISTMSPVKREAFNKVGGFREDMTFFQDWSLFYRLASAGYVGKYIHDYIFTTKAPNKDSISGDISLSLSEKAAEFRKKEGIKDKTLVVTTFGAPLQAIQRAKMLDADYVGPMPSGVRSMFPNNLMFKNWEGAYMVGFFNAPIDAMVNHLNVIPKNIGKRIIHFIGTDAWQLLNTHSHNELKLIAKTLNRDDISVLANSPRLLTEVKEAGINAQLLYTPIYNIKKYVPAKLPEKFTIGVYYSDTPNLNGKDDPRSNVPFILSLVDSLPNVHFKFFGGVSKIKSANVEECGKIKEEDMVDFIHSCSCIIRSTIHDGFPQLPIQFMLCGREAIVSCPDDELKYARKISMEEITDLHVWKNEIINHILSIQKNCADPFVLSKKAHKYYGELMSEKRFVKSIYDLLYENKEQCF